MQSADWSWQEVLRRAGVRSRQIIINFVADRVLRGGSAELDAYFVVMLCFKFVCGIMRYFTVFIVCCF